MKIRKFVAEHKSVLLYGSIIAAIVTITVLANNSEFIKGAKELMNASSEGRFECDF